MKNLVRNATLFVIGAALYFEIELHWRYFTNHLPVHWTMPILGGIMFLIVGGINEYIPWEMKLHNQAILGGTIITIIEYFSGLYLNLYMKLNIWDYSNIPLNITGQICLPFYLAWMLLSIIAIVLDDYLRYKLFDEEFPHYVL